MSETQAKTERAAHVATAVRWLRAVHDRDWAALADASSQQIAVVGPRGAAAGFSVLRDWFERVPLRLEVRQAFCRDDAVLVLHRAAWLAADGSVASAIDNASILKVQDGKVVEYARDDVPDGILARNGFALDDEVPMRPRS